LRVWGFVALAVDSSTPHHRTGCDGPAIPSGIDGFAALHYLATRPFVLPDRVAVPGSSLGGIAALGNVENNALEPDQHLKFHAAVAFYPSCTGDSGQVDVPALILIGDKDDWAWAQACRDMVADATRHGAAIDLVVYPDATHDFDVPATTPYRILGHHIAYDAAATQDAEQRVRDFLGRALR
jgi:dienelactone hydrolase